MSRQIRFLGGLGIASAGVVACTGGAPGDGNQVANSAPQYHRDCYAAVQPFPAEPPAPSRAVFVLVDQTTGLNDGLRAIVSDNLEALLGAGTLFKVAIFSARDKDHYATFQSEGEIQAPVADEALREDLPANRLEMLDACLKAQAIGVKGEAAGKIAEATSVSASTFKQSEILASLAHLSEAVKASPAEEKLVILVSDLLENSTVTKFYKNKDLRAIDPAVELKKAEDADLIGNFGGARIAVVGAGLLSPESDNDAIRNEAALQSLRAFWEQWFAQSRAELVEYGRPGLVNRLRWNGPTSPKDDKAASPAAS